ncbi:MAG: peptidoglycan DD-metalloendopeptidase family protein [Oscillospiraceae bacterium]
MTNNTTKSSSLTRRHIVPKPHRRSKLGLRLIILYFVHGFGDSMYYIGSTIVRRRRNIWRGIKVSAKKLTKAFLHVSRAVLGTLSDKLLEFFEDVAAPIRKMGKSIKSLFVVIKSSENRGFKYTMQRVRMFFKYGVLWNKHMIGRMMNFLLPVLSLAVCIAVITTMVNLNYALQISYNGQTVGFVQDESVYDSARKIIQNRMVAATQKTWKSDAAINIAVVPDDEIVTQDIMAESLLSVSGEEIAQATGLYVGGEFYGATSAGALLTDAVNSIIQPQREYAAQLGGDVDVKFAREVELVDGVYPATSIVSFDTLNGLLNSQDKSDIYYTAVGGESSADVAIKNGISLDKMNELNGSVDNILTEGTRVLVARGEQLMRVKAIKQVITTQTVRFKTNVTRDPRFLVGYMLPVTNGEDGERTIVSEIEYENGVEIGETILSDDTREPVDEEIIIGIRQEDGSTSTAVGDISKKLVWPTGAYQFISRGWSSYHFGVDIAGAYGTPIYAADNGVVTLATSIPWDYGTYVIIDHQNGLQTVYGHNSQNLVEVGDVVSRGQLIALMGSTGRSTGNHLHFETRWLNAKTDPAQYLNAADFHYR